MQVSHNLYAFVMSHDNPPYFFENDVFFVGSGQANHYKECTWKRLYLGTPGTVFSREGQKRIILRRAEKAAPDSLFQVKLRAQVRQLQVQSFS